MNEKEFLSFASNIGPFRLQAPLENATMQYGVLYDCEMKLPFARGLRHVRVWLPPEYLEHPDWRFPVLYMSDGQNLVENALSAYGDWHLDRVLHALVEEKGVIPPILVGVDCPKRPNTRSKELCPPYPVKPYYQKKGFPADPIADRYISFITDKLKPMIDLLFHTNPSRETTAIGGSSMGGIMAFYGYFYKKDVFGFSLAFSIPFFFYSEKKWAEILAELDPNPEKCGKMTMYVGGEGFEKSFVKGNLEELAYLRSLGFNEEKILFLQDPSKPHHEEAWADYSFPGLAFWLEGLKK